ncbi:MAG: hypothetical protein MJ209_01255 [archaeon]|nr:hypothetical protein [archaeon]
MEDKNFKKSEEPFGQEFEVKKNTNNANRIGFSNTLFSIGEKVYILSAQQHFDLIKEMDKVDEYKDRIKELENIISNNSDKNNLEELKEKLQEKEVIISNLKTKLDTLGKEVKTSKHEKEIKKLKKDIESLEDKADYWKNEYNELAAANESLIEDNEQLKKDNSQINGNNKLITAHIQGLNNDYKQARQEIQSTFENRESELKETIEKQQTHIDELSKKLESLSGLKEYIPPKEHYESLEELKDKIKEIETELNKVNAEVDLKLTNQKSDIELKHTEEKAQMLLVYTQELNAYKLKYNGLAKDYNHLLGDTKSLTRINTFFNGKHNLILKDKESVELEVIDVEKEPTETIEYVPKR